MLTFGLVASQSDAAASPSAVRLHIGSDGVRNFSFGTTVQPLTPGRNSCTLTGTQNVMTLASTPNQSAPGIANDSLGVKAGPSSANGTPCGQTDQVETLRLQGGPALGVRTFSGVRLDLEMTGNAVVKLTLGGAGTTRDFFLQTGTSITPAEAAEMAQLPPGPPYAVTTDAADPTDACAAPNSSGPNSNQSDNCLWRVEPGFAFTTVTLTTTIGTVALEGSADFGNNPEFDSLFFLSNAPPTAANDTATTNEDVAVDINVLANDSDLDGQPLTVAIQTPPTRGTLAPTATNGVFRYTPNPDVSGADSFVYSVSDGTASATATVSITVNAVNDPPVAKSPSVTTPEDTQVTIDVADDIDSSTINATCTGVTGGTVTNLGNGDISFTPNANFNGTVTFSCTITDGQGASATAQASVTVGVQPVNDAPVAVDDTADVDEDSSGNVIAVVGNDTDIDGGPLTVSGVTDPTNGTAGFSGGSVTYTPDTDFVGTDTFDYTVSDGNGGTDVGTVTVTVFQVICSAQTVTDTDGGVSGTFTRLTDPEVCKRYTLEADATTGTVLFAPQGGFQVAYRGDITFGPKPAPVGTLTLSLQYDPAGGTNFVDMQWCDDPEYAGLDVVSATVPPGQTWCIVSETTRAVGDGQTQTFWQVYGVDDPNFFGAR